MQQRRVRPDVLATDATLRGCDDAVCFVDLALLDQHLGQPAFGFGQVSLLVRRAQAADRVPEGLLRERDVAALFVDGAQVGERPAVAAGGARLPEDLQRLEQALLGVGGVALAVPASADRERERHRLAAAARLRQLRRALRAARTSASRRPAHRPRSQAASARGSRGPAARPGARARASPRRAAWRPPRRPATRRSS